MACIAPKPLEESLQVAQLCQSTMHALLQFTKLLKLRFLHKPLGDFKGNINASSLGSWKVPITDN